MLALHPTFFYLVNLLFAQNPYIHSLRPPSPSSVIFIALSPPVNAKTFIFATAEQEECSKRFLNRQTSEEGAEMFIWPVCTIHNAHSVYTLENFFCSRWACVNYLSTAILKKLYKLAEATHHTLLCQKHLIFKDDQFAS